MIVPGYLFPLMMIVGAALLFVASRMQIRMLRVDGAMSTAHKPFNFREYDAQMERAHAMRATPEWKRMRLILWAGAFLLILGALMQLPELLH